MLPPRRYSAQILRHLDVTTQTYTQGSVILQNSFKFWAKNLFRMTIMRIKN